MSNTILNEYSPQILKKYMDNNIKLGKLDNCIRCNIIIDKSGDDKIQKLHINNLCSGVTRLIGTNYPNMPYVIDKLLDKWNLNRDDISGRTALSEILAIMVNSNKSDRVLNLKQVYGITNNDIINDKKWMLVYNEGDLDNIKIGDLWESELKRDDISLRPLMNRFIYLLVNRDIRVYLYLYKIVKLGKDKIRFGQRFKGWTYKKNRPLSGRFKAEYAIWEYLFKLCDKSLNKCELTRNLGVLFNWYNDKSDNIIYLLHAISYFIDDIDWTYAPEFKGLSEQDIKNYYNILELKDFKLDISLTKTVKNDNLLDVNKCKDDIINSLVREINCKVKVKRASHPKKIIECLDEIGDELQEEAFHV